MNKEELAAWDKWRLVSDRELAQLRHEIDQLLARETEFMFLAREAAEIVCENDPLFTCDPDGQIVCIGCRARKLVAS